jgi:hypothetical protein
MSCVGAIGRVTAAAALCALALLAAPATSPARWVQITHQHAGSRANLGLARGRVGVLHVLWAGPNRAPFHAILDTPISPNGRVGAAQTIVSGWSGVNPPTAAASPAGQVFGIISGQVTGLSTDPFNGLNLATGPGHWTLGAHAFGNASLTEASNAIVETALLTNGQLITVWRSATTMLYQIGTDATTPPTDITPPGLGDDPAIAVDRTTGAALIAYHGVSNGSNFTRALFPSVGVPQLLPTAKTDAPQLAARAAGGFYTAYTPDFMTVRLFRIGGRPVRVPVPRGIQVFTAGLAPAPGGRLWVYYGNNEKTYVTRTNNAATRFEPVQTLASPPKLAQYFRLEGEGSAGPLDLFVDVTIDGQTKDGSYYTQVQPALSLAVVAKPLRDRRGHATRARVTASVLDAGDPVAGARVRGHKTGAGGRVVFNVPAGRHLRLKATKPGYIAASATLAT